MTDDLDELERMLEGLDPDARQRVLDGAAADIDELIEQLERRQSEIQARRDEIERQYPELAARRREQG